MAWRAPTSPSTLRSKNTFMVPGQILYENKKNDTQCVHWTPDPSIPGQPRAGEQSLQFKRPQVR